MKDSQKELNMTIEEFEAIYEFSEEKLEFIDGAVYHYSSPSFYHQEVSFRLKETFSPYFRGKGCDVILAPFDIKLSKESLEPQRVIPDLTVICNKKAYTEGKKQYVGIPALIVEVLSPSNQQHDLVIKMNLYARFGIKEYWIVNPMNASISTFVLDDSGYYVQHMIKSNGVIESMSYPDLQVNLEELFYFEE